MNKMLPPNLGIKRWFLKTTIQQNIFLQLINSSLVFFFGTDIVTGHFENKILQENKYKAFYIT